MKIPHVPFPLKLLIVAAVYAALALLARAYFAPNDVVGVFWPASGWALAVLSLGGQRYAWGVLAGALLGQLIAGQPVWIAGPIGGGETIEALVGYWLLMRNKEFDPSFSAMRDYQRLLIRAGVMGPLCNALIGTTTLTLAGVLPSAGHLQNMLQWWMGDVLGILLLTPLILVWRNGPQRPTEHKYWTEAALVLGLSFLTGQVIFLEWLPDSAGKIANQGYWMFLFITWAAIRLGTPIVTAILCMVAVQVMTGIHLHLGFIAKGFPKTQVMDSWFYLLSLGLVGMSLAIYFAERRLAEAKLRIAAIAFECQEGMIVTDASQNILRTNKSFSRIMGYSSDEVIGKPTAIMRSDRHPPSFYEAIWETSRRTGTSANEIWHRRKNGEVFPQWLTSTAVKDENGIITNFVVTHTDITFQKQQEAKRLADEAVHRDALVREVHHRIKNNLQGITGLLRQTAVDRPEVAESINQAIAQVRSIAVLHGLQGRANISRVRLCELTSAIAGDIEAQWQTPIKVDIPSVWTPCIVAENEAVPIALVLNELITNAVKHGGKANRDVGVNLRKGDQPDVIRVSIINVGRWRSNIDRPDALTHTGLKLVDILLPQVGARLENDRLENKVVTRLELTPPVITLETKDSA